MRIYVFVEHYPNPYKPWIDTQLVALLRAGHQLEILAEAGYTSTVHDEVKAYGLERMTRHYPSTLKTLTQHGGQIAGAMARHPFRSLGLVPKVWDGAFPAKVNVLSAARAAVFPETPPDVCYIHNLVTASRLTFLKELYPDTRVCLYFHGGEVGGQKKIEGEAHIFERMDAVITGTRFAAQQGIERGCPPEKIAIAPLGFNLADYAPGEPRVYRQDGRTRFVSVGRMSPEKGFPVALEAVRRLVESGERRFTYRLVGKGIQYNELVAYVKRHGLEDVVSFAGEKKRSEVAEELQAADAFVLSSLITETWAETQAAVVQEALLMKCLTITTIAGGVPESNAEVMQERFAVPPNDVDALMAAMRKVIACSDAELQELGTAGRDFAVRKYDVGPLMDRILAHACGRLAAGDPARYTAGPR